MCVHEYICVEGLGMKITFVPFLSLVWRLGTTWHSWFSSFIFWVPGIKVRLVAWWQVPLPAWAILPPQLCILDKLMARDGCIRETYGDSWFLGALMVRCQVFSFSNLPKEGLCLFKKKKKKKNCVYGCFAYMYVSIIYVHAMTVEAGGGHRKSWNWCSSDTCGQPCRCREPNWVLWESSPCS